MSIHDLAFRDLRDPFKHAYESVLTNRTTTLSSVRQLGYVQEYYPGTHEALVKLVNGLSGPALKYKVSTNYQTSMPGTGSAFSLFPGQLVEVEFANGTSDGVYLNGIIVGAIYTEKDQPSPKHSGITGGNKPARAIIDPGKDGEIGNIHVVDQKSNVSEAVTNSVSREVWGSESDVIAGPVITFTEQKLREASSRVSNIASRI